LKYIDIVKKFELLELNNIDEIEINGVYLWEVIRMKLFNEIITKLQILDKPHYTVPIKFKNKLKAFFYTLNNSIFNTLPNKNFDTIIINHPRKILENNIRIDIYTNELIKKLDSSNKKYAVLDVSLNWSKHWYKKDKNLYYYENIAFLSKILGTKYYIFNKFHNKEFSNFLNRLYKEFPSIKSTIKKLVFNEYFTFKIYEKYYLTKLKKINLKELYFVIGYVHFPMVSAAKKLGINCIEIQHGIITKIDKYYSYKNIKNRYFPDKILGFSKFWYNETLPISEKDFLVEKNNYTKLSLSKYINYKKLNNQCIIIGQGTTNKSLIKLILNNKNFLENYKVIFKLHPSNYTNWQNLYPDLVKLKNSSMINIISNYNKNLHELLAESEFQIGVYSTAIFEGLHLGCKTIILKSNGYEEIASKLDNNKCLYINSNDNLSSKIKNFNFDINYYSKKIY
jgi:hypothetical protein